MKLKRIKSGGKAAERWKKGESCLSNPKHTSFRNAAKQRHFQAIEGFSLLTTDALETHNSNIEDVSKRLTTLNVKEEDIQSEGKTFNTFATNFTACTIPAFESFFRNFTMTSSLHTRMLAIHAAVQEYMNEQSLLETSTSYLCALMASLEGIKDSEDDVAATLSLMARVIHSVNRDVLQAKFAEYAKLIEEIFVLYGNSKQVNLNLVGCLSVLLRAQSREQWTYASTMNLLKIMVDFTVHENHPMRQSSQYNVGAVLTGSSFMPVAKKHNQGQDVADELEKITLFTSHPAAGFVADFIVSELQRARKMLNAKMTLHLLNFLELIITTLSSKTLENMYYEVLLVMRIGDSIVNICALKAILKIVKADCNTAMTESLNLKIIKALTSIQGNSDQVLVPNINDTKLCCLWISVVSHSIVKLISFNDEIGIQLLSFWFQQLSFFWKSDQRQVQEEVSTSMEFLIEGHISPLGKEMSTRKAEIESLVSALQNGLSLQCSSAWSFVFRTFSAAFLTIGPHLPVLMVECLRNLSSLLNNSHNFDHNKALESAIGYAIEGIGPEQVLKIIPLRITGVIPEDERNFWILPLLQRHVRNTHLSFFHSHFIHLAAKCSVIVDNLKATGRSDSLLTKTYKTIEIQIWSLLPSFANGAVDVNEIMKNVEFAKMIRNHIEKRDDTRIEAMTALRNMVKCCQTNATGCKLADYAKNYIPILLNLYLTKPSNYNKIISEDEGVICKGHRLAAFETIRVYLTITPPKVCLEFFHKILEFFDTYQKDKEDFKQKAVLHLVLLFLPYLENVNLEVVLNVIYKELKANKANNQKTAYRILEGILKSETEVCSQFVTSKLNDIFKMLSECRLTTKSNANGSRLNCIRLFLPKIPVGFPNDQRISLFKSIIAEAVLCCGGENSVATRKASYALLMTIGITIQKLCESNEEETIQQYIELLLLGLHTTPTVMSSTILAITAVVYTYKDAVRQETLNKLMTSIVPLLSDDRITSKAVLRFIRSAYVFFPPVVMSVFVDETVAAIINMGNSCSSKFRLIAKYILQSLSKKFGSDRIAVLIPIDNEIMKKRFKNIVREIRAKKRLQKSEENKHNKINPTEDCRPPASLDDILKEIDEQIEQDGLEKEKVKTPKTILKKKETIYIKEGGEDEIVDFLDENAGQKVMSSKPKKVEISDPCVKRKTVNFGFRTDKATGKFIIQDSDDEDTVKQKPTNLGTKELDELLDSQVDDDKMSRKRSHSVDSDDSMNSSDEKESQGHKSRLSKKIRPSKKSKFNYGAEFKAKKAKGDVKKKEGPNPYAYIPLNKETLNKRKRAKYAGQFQSIVSGAKRGVNKGKKARTRKTK